MFQKRLKGRLQTSGCRLQGKKKQGFRLQVSGGRHQSVAGPDPFLYLKPEA
jgi:hypothetical protein